ncbi:MAG: DUF2892 domain-containing protein [Burkholderiales bacterium]|nr:DUF2892 domain-containing protein [Burkholderiales bacterium]
MSSERLIRIFAGAFVLASLALGVEASPLFAHGYFLWFTAFVGANLLQSGFTRVCPLQWLLHRLGAKSEAACALSAAIRPGARAGQSDSGARA